MITERYDGVEYSYSQKELELLVLHIICMNNFLCMLFNKD
nr:MAG TPA: hypothetical protein [Caudoviricetes sp.]